MRLFLLLLLTGFCFNSHASIQIWPIKPKLSGEENKKSEIKIENKSDSMKTIQARVYNWDVVNNKNVLDAQDSFVITPPIVNINPGQVQTFRLIQIDSGKKIVPMRVVFNEINQRSESSIDINIQYSIPVFDEEINFKASYVSVVKSEDSMKIVNLSENNFHIKSVLTQDNKTISGPVYLLGGREISFSCPASFCKSIKVDVGEKIYEIGD